MKILLNEATKKQIDNFIKKPSHALGIFAQSGMGKLFVAKYIASKILDKPINDNSSDMHIVRPTDKSTITIEQARFVKSFLKLKSGKSNKINRVVIISDSHLMTNEAQNSLLKILEETPKDSLIILTSTNEDQLLPTVLSRLSKIKLGNINESAVINYYKFIKNQTIINKAWIVSDGRIGLMNSIINNTEHRLLSEIKQAKKVLSCDTYKRLIYVEQITKNNPLLFVEALQIVSDVAFYSAINKTDNRLLKKLHNIRIAALQAKDNLQKNANSKLTITNLILSI